MAQHGTLATYKLRGCRCRRCIDAATAWARNRRQQLAYGRWKPFVDAEKARRHVRDLMAYGIGWQQVAKLSGVSKTTLASLLFGSPTKGVGPSMKIRPETEAKLLAVTATPSNIAKWTDPAGTRRRLQALVAIGWPLKHLAARAGFNEATFGVIASGRRPQVEAATLRAVADLYDELWNQPPKAETVGERRATQMAKAFAARQGWLPPLAWDDDVIDLPDDELQTEIIRRVNLMTSHELASAHNARERHGDRTPLTLAASREYKRRKKQQVRLGEAS